MKALQYVTVGAEPEVREIPTPEPGPGEVLLKVTAAGVCHSDDFVMSMPLEMFGFDLPLTLGHEGAGTVAAVGEGVRGLELGTSAVVYGPWGCGTCWFCAQGMENYCSRAGELRIFPPGLGAPGAIAEYLIVDSPRHLVPIGDLDPVQTVPLTDAGLTPYHAIKRSLGKLRPGSWAVVIGSGGLGHVAIQLLRQLSSARVVALDVNDEKLEFAKSVGAHEAVLSNAQAPDNVRKITGAAGASLVLDFVGYQPTIDIAMGVAGIDSDVTIVGVGDGKSAARVGFGVSPYEAAVTSPYWGARSELIELIDLAHEGAFDIAVERFDLDNAPEAYRRLAANTLRGRAVIVP
ncbi:NAD(P)-dependent alcohol dehydrogenase [Nocardia vermiculata]|uniref:alcohol dehydrogenase n=1 Tax=Nocardia vermiculata TaxID=257274 RepID=A0A846XWK5_9NOCA|nr:NAD(P)-dependent alcohol dehydrogenase [Nocardia vermiculata]NKY49458.1 NAD(P)-dependent alcohol dehydrogenase [Nocardia vermiculata]